MLPAYTPLTHKPYAGIADFVDIKALAAAAATAAAVGRRGGVQQVSPQLSELGLCS